MKTLRIAVFVGLLSIISMTAGTTAWATPDTSVQLPPEASDTWWAAVQKNIRESEYHVTWQEQTALPDLQAAYQAPNRTHNLRTYFTETGIRVIPRTSNSPLEGSFPSWEGSGVGNSPLEDDQGDVPLWEWGLELTGYGYNGQIIPVAPAKLKTSGNRIEYHRGDLIEWYVNDHRGLEQGFTLNSPPGRGQGWVSIELALTGSVVPKINADGTAIDFFAPSVNNSPPGRGQGWVNQGGARVIRYSDLHVFDASGKTLPVHFTLHENQSRLAIVVDASDARYPITVDPLATSPNWMAEGNQASAYFGISVGTAGDVNGDGYSDVIVGASHYDNGEQDEGRVFVYHGSGVGLSTTPNWMAEGDQTSIHFGCSVGIAGDVNGDSYSDIIVGAYKFENGKFAEGRAYVYHGSATGLNPAPSWTAENDQANTMFGRSVGTAGDVNGDGYSDIVISDYYHSNGETYEGAAFVWYGSAAGLGANGTPTNADWTAESNQAYAFFGRSVGTAGDVNGDGFSDIIIGADYYDNNQSNEGAVFVYYGSVAGLGADGTPINADWAAESNQADAIFGISVGTAGDVNGDGYSDIVVGARYYDNGQTDEGRAYVYHGSATGLNTTPAWIAESNQIFSEYACFVGTAGDVNGDGYSDIVVGAYNYDNGENNEGMAFVYYGSAAGLSTNHAWTAESNQAYASFGIVGMAGDVNGDGYSDVIVGAPWYDNGETNEGAAFVYHGGPDGLSETEGWTVGALPVS